MRRLCYESLASRLDRLKPPQTLHRNEIRSLFGSICEGIKALHSKEIRVCHLDIKPCNLVLCKAGDLGVQFIDFGSCSKMRAP